MAAISLTLLGAFQAVRDDVPVTHFRGNKVRALLAYLAVEADRPHARSMLAALLWPDQGAARALHNLAQALVRLRGALGDTGTLLDSTRATLQWRGDNAEVDVLTFRRLVATADPRALVRAAELYGGEFLAGFGVPGCEAFDEWLVLTREQFQQHVLAALHTLVALELQAGRFDRAALAARRQLALDPWRDAPARQRSMRAVFDWSWRLLNDAERQAVRGLSVFRGGCTREAAQAVLEAPLRVLTSLTHKSMLRWVQPHGGAGRYEVHELLRQFAAEQLVAAPNERAVVEERHAHYYISFVAERERRLTRHDPREAAAEIRGDLDNIRQAWAWAVEHRALDQLDRCTCGLWQFFLLAGLWSEGESTFWQAVTTIRVEHAGAPAGAEEQRHLQRVLSKLLAFRAALLAAPSRLGDAITDAQAAVDLARRSGGVEGEAIGCFAWAKAQFRAGQYRPARHHMERALRLALVHQRRYPALESLGVVEWHALVWLQAINARLGKYVVAKTYSTRALERCRALERRY